MCVDGSKDTVRLLLDVHEVSKFQAFGLAPISKCITFYFVIFPSKIYFYIKKVF